MALLQEWREYAYSEEMQNSKEGQKLWENYFTLEKGIYEKLLANPSEIVEGEYSFPIYESKDKGETWKRVGEVVNDGWLFRWY